MATTAIPKATRTAVEAWRALFEFMRSLDSHWSELAGEAGLSAAQGELLISLSPEEPIPMNQVARLCKCDASNVTGLVDRLEARGLVERRPALHDRRVKLIALTSKGAEIRQRGLELVYEPPPQILALSATDQRALADILRRAVPSAD